ncbi:MAG: discoidin domain-containing protein [Verrucomicrobiota bacterium]
MNHRSLFFLLILLPSLSQAQTKPFEMKVKIGDRMIGTFDPRRSFGAGIDGHEQGDCLRMLSSGNVMQMLGAGLGPISYRLRTELAVEAWHWNPRGSWSDSVHGQGYWTSESRPDPFHPILLSYGYKLPRRGNTIDEANDDGYSRLDDDDPKTFWKSNPYLSQSYTGEPDSRHPQWVVLDFGKPVPVNAIRIQWAEPYATKFRVEYADKGRVYFGGHPWNLFVPVWHRFSNGVMTCGGGGDQFLKLADHPVKARYLRIWMTESSGTALPRATDPRDHLGYSIREVSAGEADQYSFDDHVIHQPGKGQTITYASSTDPWHRVSDRDPKVEQPGVDLIARCGITRGLPLMLGVPVLYDTPENAAGLAAYIQRSGITVSRYELGEEPDGQRVDPHDFGVLYAQVSRAVRKIVPDAVMGGPSFVTVDAEPGDDQTYRFDKRWWIRDFLSELRHRNQSRDVRFLSFEWYPFDDVDGKETEQLPRASGMLARTMASMRTFHLPLVIGELNYSVFPCQQEVDLAGGLLNAETMAQFLCEGGDAAFYYGYEPNRLEGSSGSWGNQLMLLQADGNSVPVATFQSLSLLTCKWMNPQGGPHAVLPVRISGDQEKLLSSFALKRPDGTRSLLVINKDALHPVRLSIKGLGKHSVTLTSYSSAQYSWRSEGENGHPSLNLPPLNQQVSVDQPISIPPWSVSVIR